MAQEVKLRLYDARDEVEVLELWKQAWGETNPKKDYQHELNRWFRTRWKTRLVPKTTITVARTYTEIVGFFTIDRTNGFIDEIIVAPEYRGRGVGGELLKEAKRLSPERVELVVSAHNTSVISYYKKNGFTIGRLMASPSGGLVRRMHWPKI